MKTQKTPKTLGESTFEWVTRIEKSKKESVPGRPSTNAERQRYLHIRRVALKEIEDLRRLAECLPEDQLQQIFNDKNLQGLFRALLNLKGLNFNNDRELLKEKRHRLLPICNELITLLNDGSFAGMMAPTIRHVMVREGGFFWGIKTVYYRSLIARDEEWRQLAE